MNLFELRERLIEFDEEILLLFEDKKFECVIVGGGAFLIMGFISRATMDIDILSASEEIIPFFDKYDMNMKVSELVFRFPYNYEDRLVKIEISTKAVTYYSLSLEDLIVSKLYARRRKDQQDIRTEEVIRNVDWIKLDNLIIEAELSALNKREYNELITSYEDYLLLKEWFYERT